MIQLACGHGQAREELQTVFVSDIHLGSRYCQASRFFEFIDSHDIHDLYLVGDIIDGWRLKRRWRWPEIYHRIFRRLLEMQREGTRLHYAPGNHDEFLRHYLMDFGVVDVADEFVYETVNGGRMLVLHGDRFDRVESSIPWLSIIGATAYETIMWLNHATNAALKSVSMSEKYWSGQVKQKVKTVVKFISDFESSVSEYARQQGCDGVICGHIHVPSIVDHQDIVYCNTGDWVEHCTALVEHHDGSWELRDLMSGGQYAAGVTKEGDALLGQLGRRRLEKTDADHLCAGAV